MIVGSWVFVVVFLLMPLTSLPPPCTPLPILLCFLREGELGECCYFVRAFLVPGDIFQILV
jgi:hypothetical protein